MTPRKRPAIEKDPLYRNDHAFSLMKVDAEPLSCAQYHMECYFTPVTKTTSRPVPARRQILRLGSKPLSREEAEDYQAAALLAIRSRRQRPTHDIGRLLPI